MSKALITRAAYLHLYLDVFREIGIPVEPRLSNSKLPSLIEEQPDAYVSLPLALDWIAHTASDLTPMELGFISSRAVTLDTCDPSLQTAVLYAATGRARIERFFRLAGVEDNSVIPRYHREGDHVRLIIGNSPLDGHPNACLAQWMNIQLIITIIKSIAGKAWLPAEITFVSSLAVPEVAQETFRNTRILTGQQSTSVLVQAEIFARSCYDMASAETDPFGETFDSDAMEGWTFIRTLRSLIKPYLGEEGFDLGAATELAGMSARSLQRRLNHCGTSYGALVQETRFHIARSMLSDTSAMVRDVAMSSGYENPQHFSRAFRRMTGMSPSEYRKNDKHRQY